jgi:hypothetical protein
MESTVVNHYLVYHNPETMGSDVRELTGFSIVTTKSVKEANGSRVWLITGRGSPRAYTLTHTFVADKVESNTDSGINRVSGESGIKFRQEIGLNHLPWFPDFRKTLGNFGLGFQRITEQRFITALESLVRNVDDSNEPRAIRRRPKSGS